MPKKTFIVVGIILLAGAVAGLIYFVWQKSATKISSQPEALHYSYFSQPDFFESAYKSAKPQDYQPDAKAIIVNHHLLAGNFIAEAFNTIATAAPVTVVLISPNHFSAGRGLVITSAAEWQTPYGILQPDLGVIGNLSKAQLVSIEEQPFEQEHGISGIVSFIKKSLPNAKVVPLIFKDQMSLELARNAADNIHRLMPNNSLVVGSFDFSHYLTSRAADFHDIKNLSAVENFDFGSLYNLDMDSHPGLAFFLQLLKNNHLQNFSLLEHSNSAKLTKQDVLETTSYITGYFSSGASGTSSAKTLLSLGNIEASPELGALLNQSGTGTLMEFMDRLFLGQDYTTAFLIKSDLTSETQLQKRGISLSGEISHSFALADFYIEIMDCSAQQNRPKDVIEKGAHAVVCQGAPKNYVELYKNRPIIFAAGNFLDENTINNKQTSLAVGLAAENDTLRIFLLPIGVQAGQIQLLTASGSDRVLIDMEQASKVSEDLKKGIARGLITIKN